MLSMKSASAITISFFTQQRDVDLEVDVPGLEATTSYRHRMTSEKLCSDSSATLGGAPFFAGHETTFLQPAGPSSDVLALLPVDATPLSTMRLYDDCRYKTGRGKLWRITTLR